MSLHECLGPIPERLPNIKWTEERDARLREVVNQTKDHEAAARILSAEWGREVSFYQVRSRATSIRALIGRHTPWTDECDALMRKLFAEKRPVSKIAAELGLTRNSVIGRLHRAGLSRGRVPRAKPDPNAPKRPRAVRPVLQPPVDASSIPIEQRRSIFELTDHTCRWPFGDPQLPGFFFCGAEPEHASSYCPQHTREARPQLVR